MTLGRLSVLEVPGFDTVVAEREDWDDEPANNVTETIQHDLEGTTEDDLCEQTCGHVLGLNSRVKPRREAALARVNRQPSAGAARTIPKIARKRSPRVSSLKSLNSPASKKTP